MLTLNPNANRTQNLIPREKIRKVLKKVKKKKREFAKVRVDLKSNGVPLPEVKHNHYVTRSMPIA